MASVLPLGLWTDQRNRAESWPTGKSGACGQPGVKHYPLQGTVVSVDKAQQHLVIDHKDIPGFMGAMTMPYPVADAKVLDQVGPGDQITADVVVSDTSVRLEKVVVVKKGSGAKPQSELQPSQPAGTLPDFTLVNQDGKRIGLRQYRGRALLITFIYTRCPLPDYCPLMTHNFAEIDKALEKSSCIICEHALAQRELRS